MNKKNIKLLFINPVIRAEDKPRHIPYGLAQLVALAKKDGYRIQVFDANAWRPKDKQLRQVLGADQWDVIAIGGLVTTYGYIKKCVQFAREINPDALIVAGGGFLSAIPKEIMEFLPQLDVGVIGEGVVTFPEVLQVASCGGKDFSSIKGIVWRGTNGEIKLTSQRPLLEDLDSLPFPAYEMFPIETYFKNSSLLMSEEAMQSTRRMDVMASYGCAFGCKFCFHLGLSGEILIEDSDISIDINTRRRVRMHSPEYVINLVGHLKKAYNVDFVAFMDENFVFLNRLNNGEWTKKFFDLWKKAGFTPKCIRNNETHSSESCQGIHWGTTAHVNLVSPEFLIQMRKTGCSYLDYGLESFSDDILKSIGKGATAAANERALKWTIEAGIRPIPNQIIGFPHETFESIKTSAEAWHRLGIKAYPFFATPYPGSEWFFEYKDRILDQYDGDLERFLLDLGDATKITAVISENFNAIELLGLRELMVNNDIKRINEYESICNCKGAGGERVI